MTDHVSDCDLMLYLDGELDALSHAPIRHHLELCHECRERSEQLFTAGVVFEREYQRLTAPHFEESRAGLAGRMKVPSQVWKVIAAVLVIAFGLRIGLLLRSAEAAAFAPMPALTPGATRAVSRMAVCSESPELRRVADDVAKQIFKRYGIQSPAPKSYEIDYLIPPDLGGSEDDPRNLWPQPYGRGVWNARVKDALEDRLRGLVCEGKLDLTTAQRELAADWIGAYKRHFRTDKPLLDHVAFYKDQPWE